LEDSAHSTFTDFPLLLKLLGLTPLLPPATIDLIGTLDGSRALDIISTYVTAFFDFVLSGKDSGLLKGPSSEFPEVAFDP